MAWRSSDSTMTMRVKAGHHEQYGGHEGQCRERKQRLYLQRISLPAAARGHAGERGQARRGHGRRCGEATRGSDEKRRTGRGRQGDIAMAGEGTATMCSGSASSQSALRSVAWAVFAWLVLASAGVVRHGACPASAGETCGRQVREGTRRLYRPGLYRPPLDCPPPQRSGAGSSGMMQLADRCPGAEPTSTQVPLHSISTTRSLGPTAMRADAGAAGRSRTWPPPCKFAQHARTRPPRPRARR